MNFSGVSSAMHGQNPPVLETASPATWARQVEHKTPETICAPHDFHAISGVCSCSALGSRWEGAQRMGGGGAERRRRLPLLVIKQLQFSWTVFRPEKRGWLH